MRLSDLLASTVFDHDGRAIGRVRDVRLVQDGPLVDARRQPSGSTPS
jgi:sporulation protein YlmC with PRC-barrel domain